MRIRTTPVVPRDVFARLDEDWHEYGVFSGIATRWHVLGPYDGSEYWVVPHYDGRGPSAPRVAHACFIVSVEPLTEKQGSRGIRLALSTAAQQAALGIANALALEQILPELL